MFAARRTLLWTFAGGCVSGAVLLLSGVGLVSLLRGEGPRLAHDDFRDHGSVTARRTQEASDAPATAAPLAAPSPDAQEPHDELAVVKTPDPNAKTTPDPTKDKGSDTDAGGTPEPGSSVADVLVRLETQYRQGLAAAVSHDAEASNDRSTAPGSPAVATTVTVTSTPAASASTRSETAVSVAVTVTPPAAPAPVAPAPEPRPLEVTATRAEAPEPFAAEPVAVATESAPAELPAAAPPQTVNIGTLHQGDVYQVQQIALMQQQYIPIYAGLPYPGYVAPPPATTHSHQHGSPFSTPPLPQAAPPFPSFLSSVTNPANPWGYQYGGMYGMSHHRR